MALSLPENEFNIKKLIIHFVRATEIVFNMVIAFLLSCRIFAVIAIKYCFYQ